MRTETLDAGNKKVSKFGSYECDKKSEETKGKIKE